MSKEKIDAILNIIESSYNGAYANFVVGICSDPIIRIFDEHEVVKDNDEWFYFSVPDLKIARENVNHLLEFGLKRQESFQIEKSEIYYLYVFKMTANTIV